MHVHEPEQMSRAFVDAFNAGNVEELISLYEPDAAYVHGAQTVIGHAALHGVFKQLTAVRPKMDLTNEYCVVFENIALVRARWRLQWRDAVQLHVKHGHSSEVLRRGADGVWRYIIDHPTGGD
jgi:ketosteroid isomerase-like protein